MFLWREKERGADDQDAGRRGRQPQAGQAPQRPDRRDRALVQEEPDALRQLRRRALRRGRLAGRHLDRIWRPVDVGLLRSRQEAAGAGPGGTQVALDRSGTGETQSLEAALGTAASRAPRPVRPTGPRTGAGDPFGSAGVEVGRRDVVPRPRLPAPIVERLVHASVVDQERRDIGPGAYGSVENGPSASKSREPFGERGERRACPARRAHALTFHPERVDRDGLRDPAGVDGERSRSGRVGDLDLFAVARVRAMRRDRPRRGRISEERLDLLLGRACAVRKGPGSATRTDLGGDGIRSESRKMTVPSP